MEMKNCFVVKDDLDETCENFKNLTQIILDFKEKEIEYGKK